LPDSPHVEGVFPVTLTALRLSALTALSAGVVAVAAPALAATLADPTVTTTDGRSVLVLDDTETGSRFIPKGGEPTDEFPQQEPSPGDAFSFTDDLRQNGALVATDKGTCTITGPEQAVCDVLVTFANGTVSAKGTSSFDDEESDFPLTGGTGAYEGIRGTATSHDFSDAEDPSDTKSTITVTFTLPGTDGQVTEVPTGGAATGGGLAGDGMPVALFAIGGAAIVTGVGIAGVGRRLRGNR
jgi:hypothetical protein